MNADIKSTVKQCATCLDHQQIQSHDKTIPYDILCKPWEVVGADVLSINNNTLLCVVNYYSKFLIVQKTYALSADDLIRVAKIVFSEF